MQGLQLHAATAKPIHPPTVPMYRRAEVALSEGNEELAKEALSRRRIIAVRRG